MLLQTKKIAAIIDLISENGEARAIARWKTILADSKKCDVCFYLPLAETVRCGSCLEGHLTQSVMSYTYPKINQDALERAERAVKAWVKAHRTA
ncbi:MAG: hypothetical protein JKY27_09265 [Magnetovibrio sp.]|nr:hypothetical protein [Magnetovibrio sp.]